MKKNFYIALILAAALAVTGLLLYKYGPTRQPAGQEAPAETAVTNAVEGVIEEAPAAEDQAEEEAPVIEISADMQRRIGVKTTEAKVIPLKKTIRTVGRIEADERKTVAVSVKFEGWIEKLHANFTGMFVRKGEPLAEIYSPELLATQEEFLVALRWAKAGGAVAGDSDVLLEGARRRLRLWDISGEQIKRLEETGEATRTLTIHSPVSGYIVEKAALEGARVMPGERLMSIADLSTIWVMADIYEYELGLLKPGQRAEIELSYLPGVKLTSRVDYVYPTISAETRTAKIRFEVANPKMSLRPQMFTDVVVKVDLGQRLVVPEDSVIDTGERQVVYVDRGEGYFEPREIRTGLREAGMREVLAGLKPGEKVASSAAFLIDSEAQLTGVQPLGLKPADGLKPEGGRPAEHRH